MTNPNFDALLPSSAVHGIHEIIMEDSDAEQEFARRNY